MLNVRESTNQFLKAFTSAVTANQMPTNTDFNQAIMEFSLLSHTFWHDTQNVADEISRQKIDHKVLVDLIASFILSRKFFFINAPKQSVELKARISMFECILKSLVEKAKIMKISFSEIATKVAAAKTTEKLEGMLILEKGLLKDRKKELEAERIDIQDSIDAINTSIQDHEDSIGKDYQYTVTVKNQSFHVEERDELNAYPKEPDLPNNNETVKITGKRAFDKYMSVLQSQVEVSTKQYINTNRQQNNTGYTWRRKLEIEVTCKSSDSDQKKHQVELTGVTSIQQNQYDSQGYQHGGTMLEPRCDIQAPNFNEMFTSSDEQATRETIKNLEKKREQLEAKLKEIDSQIVIVDKKIKELEKDRESIFTVNTAIVKEKADALELLKLAFLDKKLELSKKSDAVIDSSHIASDWKKQHKDQISQQRNSVLSWFKAVFNIKPSKTSTEKWFEENFEKQNSNSSKTPRSR